MIVATDVLHATADIVKTLKTVRQLMAPEGFLLMNEFVNTPVWIQTVFGTLSGWWRFQDPERRSVGPTLSEKAWCQAFADSGWATTYPLHDRKPQPIHASFLVAATAVSGQESESTPIFVLANDSHTSGKQAEEQEAIIAQLTRKMNLVTKRDVKHVSNTADLPYNSTVVYLPSLMSSTIFDGPSDTEFMAMKAIAENCQEVYWVTRGGNMDCPLPQNAPLVGFSRVMKNERPALKSCVIDVDPKFDSVKIAASLVEALHSPQLQHEDELVARKGASGDQTIFYVPRLAAKRVSADLQRTEQKTYGECAGLQLEVGTAGLLNTLQWRASSRTMPSRGQVEVQVYATGLNFKGNTLQHFA